MRQTYHPGLKAVVYHWDTPAEMAQAADKGCAYKPSDRSWTNETWAEAVKRAIEGDLRYVAQAEKLLEQVGAQIDAPRHEWVPSPCGAFPIVPDVLAGLPFPMRRKIEVANDRAPLRIYLDTTSSAGVPHTDLLKRGITYLALALAVGAVRPVELYVTCGLGRGTWKANGEPIDAGINVMRIPSAPFDLATACNALTSCGLTRSIGYQWCQQIIGTGGGWEWDLGPFNKKDRATYVANLREVLGASEHDLIVPPTHIYDDEAVTDPIGFLKRTIKEHTNPGEGDEA